MAHVSSLCVSLGCEEWSGMTQIQVSLLERSLGSELGVICSAGVCTGAWICHAFQQDNSQHLCWGKKKIKITLAIWTSPASRTLGGSECSPFSVIPILHTDVKSLFREAGVFSARMRQICVSAHPCCPALALLWSLLLSSAGAQPFLLIGVH